MKVCSKCKQEQEFGMFAKAAGRRDGLNPQCKACTKLWRDQNKDTLSAKKKEYYLKNIEEMPERNKQKYLKHKDKQRAAQTTYYAEPVNWVKRMLAKSSLRAEQAGLEFAITAEDIVVPLSCPYLKTLLTFDLGRGQLPTNASLDRIDSTRGYVKGNVQVISRKANTMKSNATHDELLTFAQSILDNDVEKFNLFR